MRPAPLPVDEPQRLAELYSYCVLDTEPEQPYDDLVELAASVCQTPIALVSLIDRDRQWFKARRGVTDSGTPRKVAFCAHAILERTLLVVPDAHADERFRDSPLVEGPLGIRSYAGVPIHGFDGHAIGTLCVLDHEPRHFTSAQLDLLRRLARQAEVLLEQRRLARRALHAAEVRTDFLATISRELRTPLNGVIGFVELLTTTSLSHEQRELVSELEASSDHLLGVVGSVLDLAQLDAGQVHLDAQPVDLHDLAVSALAPLQERAAIKGLAMRIDWTCRRSGSRMGDANRLRQVLQHLVGNAVKFTTTGSVTLRIDDEADSDMVVFAVHDTGVGIDPAAVPTLLDGFASPPPSNARRPGATGFGLAIVRQLVLLMHGTISVQSRPGVGSRFVVRVPMAVAPATATAPPAEAVSHVTLHDRRVLVVDDDATSALVLRRLLQEVGASVDVVIDGGDAVSASRVHPYDIIFMDCMMPVVDGYEATRRIRRLPLDWVSNVPIIGVTASALPDTQQRCLDAGMTECLTKPVRRQTLLAAIKRTLVPAAQRQPVSMA